MNMLPSYNVRDHNYDAMHAVGNVLEDMVRLFSGKLRVFTSNKLPFEAALKKKNTALTHTFLQGQHTMTMTSTG